MKALKSPAFIAPAAVLPITALFRLLSFTEQARVELVVFGIGLLLLLSAWLVLPASWLLRKLMKRDTVALPRWAKVMPWLVLLNAIVLTVFFAAIAAYALGAATENNLMFLFGAPASLWPWFLLPAISIVLSVVIVIGVVAGWRGGWGWLRRINRAAYAIAGVVCLVVLGAWGMLLAPFFR